MPSSSFIDVNVINPIEIEFPAEALDTNSTIVGTPNVAITNDVTSAVNNFSYDPSGRLRVGQLTTMLDGKILNVDNARLFENVGTGTGTFTNNKYNMAVTSGQYLIRQSRRFTPYFSGKAQLIEETFDNFQPQANVVKRIGYFSSNAVAPYDTTKDGVWLESDGTTIRLICSRAGTETLNVAITAWSGYADLAEYQTLANWQNFTVVAFDFLWLGGAVLRLYVKTSTGFVLAHTFNYAGSAQDVFILSPNQPVRYEIRSSTGVGSMRYVCCQVATEGSFNEAGETISVFNTAAITANAIGTIYALKSVRKIAARRDMAIQIVGMDVTNAATADAGILMLIQNPTVSASISYATNSNFEDGTPTTQTITAGTGRVVCALPVGSNGGGTQIMKENFLSFLSGTIANVFDEYVLAYMPVTANQTVHGVLTIKEY